MIPGAMKFHHLGLAVQNEAEGLAYLSVLGYSAGEKIYDPEQNVHVRLCTAPHLPAVDDIDAIVNSLEYAKLRVLCLSPPKPAILFGGRMVSFYRVIGFGIIELLQAA